MNTLRSTNMVMKGVARVIDEQPPLKKTKDATIAAIYGLFLGGLGLGIYLRTWRDFFLPIAIWIVMAIVALPTGELLLSLAPVFCAYYGYRRVQTSNAKLQNSLGDSSVINVFPVTAPPLIAANPPADERLRKLDHLLENKLITSEEHAVKRQKILDAI